MKPGNQMLFENHIDSTVRNLDLKDQDIFLNEVIEVIHRCRTQHLQALVEQREEHQRRLEEIDSEISDLKKRIEQLDMRRQAQECDATAPVLKEEESGFAVGKKVKIHDRTHGHQFKIGQVVEIVSYDEKDRVLHWRCRGEVGGEWWISEHEATVV